MMATPTDQDGYDREDTQPPTIHKAQKSGLGDCCKNAAEHR